jgi:uncharacterized repeat protein (TIGR01451 family)
MTRHSIVTGAGLTAGAVLGIAPAAQAADFTVTNLSDSPTTPAPGSLRKAILDANANPGPDRILFSSSLSGTINMTGDQEFVISQPVDIEGPGADRVAIDAFRNSRVFYVYTDPAAGSVTISGLTVAQGLGGGRGGGGIFNKNTKLTVQGVTLAGNAINFGVGGAIADYQSSAETTITDSTIFGNYATNGSGGGVGSTHQLGTITNSTIVNNYAEHDGGGLYSGIGGSIRNSTVADNYADEHGGGIAIGGSGGPNTVIQNSIVGDNSAGTSGADLSGSDPFDVQFSLLEDTTGLTINDTAVSSNIIGSDPRLSSYIGYSGGSTPTVLPEYNSPVIDKGKAAAGVTADQRGFTRPRDLPDADFPNSTASGADGADMGAVEVTARETAPADLALSMTSAPDEIVVGDPIEYAFQVDNHGPTDATGVVLTEFFPREVSLNTSSLSGDCDVGPSNPSYGTYVYCAIGDLGSGQSRTLNATTTEVVSPAPYPYLLTYADGVVVGNQLDNRPFNNNAYTATYVFDGPTPPPPTPPSTTTSPPTTTFPSGKSPGVARAIRRCKKKFHGKKRKSCIKRAKVRAASTKPRRRFHSRSYTRLKPLSKAGSPLYVNSRLARLIGRARRDR